MERRIRVGTSGWHYAHWRGPFYPKELRHDQMLPFCAARFSSLEINNSFYRLPSKETFRAWASATPRDFLFAVKASRFITHNKKLKDPKASVKKFFASASALEPKIAAVLFQLPPRWRRNVSRLDEFLRALPQKRRYAFEFRDPSWFHEETYAALERHNAAFCVWDLAGEQSPKRLTANFAYLRLHGPDPHKYSGSYTGSQLRGWMQYCEECIEKGATDVFVYFDNDQAGYAVLNAMALQKMIPKRQKDFRLLTSVA